MTRISPTGLKRSIFISRNRADALHQCWPSIGTIARELSLSRSTVQRAIHDLREQGYLETQQRWRENGGKSSLLFRLIK